MTQATATKTRTTKATKTTAKKTTAKQTPEQKAAAERKAECRKVVTMRDAKKAPASWAVIADALGIAPRTARRMYDEVKGEGAHHGLLPGKGGRQVA